MLAIHKNIAASGPIAVAMFVGLVVSCADDAPTEMHLMPGPDGSGGTPNTGGVGGAGGVGGDGGDSAAGGQAGSSFNVCYEPLVEPGEDGCMACAYEYCCGAFTAGWCLSPFPEMRDNGESRCYRDLVKGCVVECYESSSADKSSWETVKSCVDACELEGDDAGVSEMLDFPLANSAAGNLVECIVGSTVDDPGVPEGAPGPFNYGCELKGTCYHRSPCAEVCFGSWREVAK